MFRIGFVALLLSSIFQSSVVLAGGCQKTLMGSDCAVVESATAAHMRENAADNAKAKKELKAAIAQSKQESKKLAMKK